MDWASQSLPNVAGPLDSVGGSVWEFTAMKKGHSNSSGL
jgi:hypothetical protein